MEQQVSAREAEVLAAVAAHLTNAEIAAQLFISVRTVESHVSALLRKLGAADRRELIALAPPVEPAATPLGVPVALTPFIGRAEERAALAAALTAHRLVTAVGPGGVGKTRLAQAVAADLRTGNPTRTCYVDLVPVSSAAMVATAVADSLGLGEQRDRSPQQAVVAALADRDALLVLDNCEHVLDGVVGLLDDALAQCPRLRVLATSRVRLLVPYEHVFAVPGLEIATDAVALFRARAEAAGQVFGGGDDARAAAVCRGLDGMALAIELAAARLPALGWDGLGAGLADRLDLLAGGRRIDDRHRSLRATLDWSWALLEDATAAALRRVSVFATPFGAGDAVAVGAGPTVPAVTARLASLAEHNLLVALTGGGPTRYLALETVRQYGSEQLDLAAEREASHRAHERWALDRAAGLLEPAADVPAGWRDECDRIAAELRGALARPSPSGHLLADRLGELTFARGLPGEAQRAYEQAALLAPGPREAALALHLAAGAATTRHFGDEALRLHRAAADAALAAGDPARAAGDLARLVELVHRASGLLSRPPGATEVDATLAEAATLAGEDPSALAAVAVARAHCVPDTGPPDATRHAIAAARTAGDRLAECSALDRLMTLDLVRGDLAAVAASARRRTGLLAGVPARADTGLELFDGYGMAADTAVAVGDLRLAGKLAGTLRDLPFYREEGHLAVARLLVATALTGDWDETMRAATAFRRGWDRAGRPYDGDVNRSAYAVATVCALRGDTEGEQSWRALAEQLMAPELRGRDGRCYETLDALALLHRGRPGQAVERLGDGPPAVQSWRDGMWLCWHAALSAEAGVLAGTPDAPDRLAAARTLAAPNPVAVAIVQRADALARGDHARLAPLADRFRAAGCRYQAARTLVLAGGRSRAAGEDELRAMGATV